MALLVAQPVPLHVLVPAEVDHHQVGVELGAARLDEAAALEQRVSRHAALMHSIVLALNCACSRCSTCYT